MRIRSTCPGCGNELLAGEFQLLRQPVVLNYRCPDIRRATQIPRGDIHLRQCQRCGLVFNASFDPRKVLYDENYENRQCFSPAFTTYLERMAQDLTHDYGLNRKSRVLEVGCGKGDFLRLLSRTSGAFCVGYDTSFEPPEGPEQPGVEFHRCYLRAQDIQDQHDAVICRHVVEHVPEIGQFLQELHAIAIAAKAGVVVLETPRFEWIAQHVCLWDVFYEHCNYFPTPGLAHLCRRSGFRVIRHRSVFGGQYQVLELSPERASSHPPRPPGIRPTYGLGSFSAAAGRKLRALETLIQKKAGGGPWAVWGAGAKGVAFAHQLSKQPPSVVIDSNPMKQGGVIPGTRVPIVGPEDPSVKQLKWILIANPNYAREIRQQLRQHEVTAAVSVLS